MAGCWLCCCAFVRAFPPHILVLLQTIAVTSSVAWDATISNTNDAGGVTFELVPWTGASPSSDSVSVLAVNVSGLSYVVCSA